MRENHKNKKNTHDFDNEDVSKKILEKKFFTAHFMELNVFIGPMDQLKIPVYYWFWKQPQRQAMFLFLIADENFQGSCTCYGHGHLKLLVSFGLLA